MGAQRVPSHCLGTEAGWRVLPGSPMGTLSPSIRKHGAPALRSRSGKRRCPVPGARQTRPRKPACGAHLQGCARASPPPRPGPPPTRGGRAPAAGAPASLRGPSFSPAPGSPGGLRRRLLARRGDPEARWTRPGPGAAEGGGGGERTARTGRTAERAEGTEGTNAEEREREREERMAEPAVPAAPA